VLSYKALGADFRSLDPLDTFNYRVGETITTDDLDSDPIYGFPVPSLALWGVFGNTPNPVWLWPSHIVGLEGDPVNGDSIPIIYERATVVTEYPVDIAFGPNGSAVVEILRILRSMDTSALDTFARAIWDEQPSGSDVVAISVQDMHMRSEALQRVADVVYHSILPHASMTVAAEVTSIFEMLAFTAGIDFASPPVAVATWRAIAAVHALMVYNMVDGDAFECLTKTIFAAIALQAGVNITDLISTASS
jgi:hypothetical protein